MTHTKPYMSFPRYLFAALLAASVVLPAAAQDNADEQPVTIRWEAKDNTGEAFAVPVAGKTSVVLFVMPDQARSNEAMTQLDSVLSEQGGNSAVQPVAVVSGHDAGVGAAALSQDEAWAWPVVVDPDYQASGLMAVRVWPTTVIVDPAGKRVAHLPGLRESYTKDLRAYLDFAAGAIDAATLDKRLNDHGTIASTSDNIASRHLHLAEKLLEKGQTRLAHDELERGMAADPQDIELRLTLAHVRLMLREPDEALAVLDKIDAQQAPAWRTGTLRGWALVELQRWDEARAALLDALKINPDPSQASYFLGRVHEQAGEWQQAAQAYRNAFEKSTASEPLGEL